jgi:hypothetical protein
MAGEFVRTPKRGEAAGRYWQYATLPLAEIGLCLVSLASVVASIETGHWFATPFAALFTYGYGYVAWLVASEQLGQRLTPRALASQPAGVGGAQRAAAGVLDASDPGVADDVIRAA